MPIRPRIFRSPNIKEFVDRIEVRKAFWNRYDRMIQQGSSTIISFYGAGGVGKTALLKKLEEEVRQYRDILQRPYIKYDFSIGTDIRDVLKTFKFQLSDYGCNFPLFDIGNYYYSLAIGQDIVAPKVQSMFEQLPLVQEVKKKLSKVGYAATKKFLDTETEIKSEPWLEHFINATMNGLGSAMPIMKTITIFMSAADMLLEEYMKRKGILDENHQFIRNELNARRQEKDPILLYEYLPTLFAIDVTDWMEETGNKLIAFLDNYESLSGTTNFMSTEQRKRDLWLRGDDGLIYNIPNTLWAIAGRNELLLGGELETELEKQRLNALLPQDSDAYLKKAGISNENLREGIASLTNGYPIFLDLCVDVYVEYKRQHNSEPPLEEFGQKREEVVGRIFKYIDAENDDAAKDMLAFLCVLKIWTDEIAVDVGGLTISNFSRTTYNRVKKFTFIHLSNLKNEDLNLKIFRFDNTIQNLLISTCDEKLISDVKKSLNNYFKKNFAAKKIFDSKEIFYLKLWAEFVVNFTDDIEKLFELYKELFVEYILCLINTANFEAVEKILTLFMNKLESLSAANELPYTYFEIDFGRLLRAQGKYNESYKIINSAYEKRANILGKENPLTIESMQRLAVSLNDLGNYEVAIKFHRQVLSFRKNFLGEEHPDTVESMHHLATSLNNFGKYEEALKLREKVLIARKNIFGAEDEKTFNAMNNLSVSLSDVGRYEEAFNLRKKSLKLSKKIFGEEHPNTIAAMSNFAISLYNLNRNEEALKLQEKSLALYEKILGEEHPTTIAEMNNLALSLSNLNRHEEELALKKRVFDLHESILGKNHPNTLIAMNNFAISLYNLNRYEEALELQKDLLSLSKKNFGEEYPHTIAFMSNLAMSLGMLERYEETLKFQEQVLKSYINLLGEEHPNTIKAMENLALSLCSLNRYEEALPLYEKILILNRKKFGEDDATTSESADNLADILKKLGRCQEEIALQKK